MVYKENRLTIPSNVEYSVPQLKLMIQEVEEIVAHKIMLETWNHF